VATLRTARRTVRLRDDEGRLIAEFCDDHVRAEPAVPSCDAPLTWREWELELAEPNSVLAEGGVRVLVAAGAAPASAPSKLARALASPAIEIAGSAIAPRSPTTTAEVLQAHLVLEVAALGHLDPVVRADLPDAVHQMRVIARRLRSVLAAYAAEFDVSVTEPLRSELGWLIGRLGRARDLEVLRSRIQSTYDGHQAVGAWLGESTEGQHLAAHRDALSAMTSDRYFTLVDQLAGLAALPPWSGRAARPPETEMVSALHRQWRRVEKAADRASSGRHADRDRHLHDVRRAVKRLRYATDAASPVLRGRADVLITALAEIQDVLGRHHDAVVAIAFVAAAEQSGSADRTETRKVERRLADEASADRKRFERLYRRLRRSEEIRWIR
jgi:CHAD domain-containing protein